jgi:hypothetical protein
MLRIYQCALLILHDNQKSSSNPLPVAAAVSILCRNNLRVPRQSREPVQLARMFRSLLRLPIRDARRFPSVRANSTSYQAPERPKSNPHRDFYRGPFRPIAYNVLIALATFQAIYWSWLKLESLEVKQTANKELQALEGELESLVPSPADSGAKR